jgi:hypothetical protein
LHNSSRMSCGTATNHPTGIFFETDKLRAAGLLGCWKGEINMSKTYHLPRWLTPQLSVFYSPLFFHGDAVVDRGCHRV